VEPELVEYLCALGFRDLKKLTKKGSSLHIFTHIRRTSIVYTVRVEETVTGDIWGEWLTEEGIGEYPVSELGRKVLRLALGVEKKRAGDNAEKKGAKKVKLEKGQTKLAFTTQRKVEI
jgi:hypothetical protein